MCCMWGWVSTSDVMVSLLNVAQESGNPAGFFQENVIIVSWLKKKKKIPKLSQTPGPKYPPLPTPPPQTTPGPVHTLLMCCVFVWNSLSALNSALSLSKCHLVSLILCSFTKNSNLRWKKRYITSETLRLTACVVIFQRAAVLSNSVFFNSLFFYFCSSHVPRSIMMLFCAHRQGCTAISHVGKGFYVEVILIIQWFLN